MLENLSLKLEPGTVTAIVGRSGSGKSTIAALISKFYKPDKCAPLPHQPLLKALPRVSCFLPPSTLRPNPPPPPPPGALPCFSTRGGVFLNDQPAQEFSALAWSNAIALVGQEPVLFDGTIPIPGCPGSLPGRLHEYWCQCAHKGRLRKGP